MLISYAFYGAKKDTDKDILHVTNYQNSKNIFKKAIIERKKAPGSALILCPKKSKIISLLTVICNICVTGCGERGSRGQHWQHLQVRHLLPR